MGSQQDKSITLLIEGLREGSHDAARQLWDRYFQQLVRLAEQKMASSPKRVTDEEDVAISVFRRLCDVAAKGGFEQMKDRNDLWHLLIKMTANRVIDDKRFFSADKRGQGRVRGESLFITPDGDLPNEGLDAIPEISPTPELLVEFAEEHKRLMGSLDGDLLKIAELKLAEHEHEEIARQLNITSRSVRRKLQRIRQVWAEVEAE